MAFAVALLRFDPKIKVDVAGCGGQRRLGFRHFDTSESTVVTRLSAHSEG